MPNKTIKIGTKAVAHFLKEINNDSTHVWASSKMKIIDPIISQCVLELYKLEPLRYIKITPTSILASSQLSGRTRKIPMAKPFDETAIGVHLIFDFKFKTVEFYEINSAVKGWWQEMVKAVIINLPTNWQPAIVFDYSNGFWNAMKVRFPDSNWLFV